MGRQKGQMMFPVLGIAVLGVLALGAAAGFMAYRYGWLAGLVLPALASLVAVLRTSLPVGHAEEVMGRGIEVLTVWVPVVCATVIGAGLGLFLRKGRGDGPEA